MDEVPLPQPTPPQPQQPQIPPPAVAVYAVAPVCPQCHFPTKPEYYFCPNCGTKLTEPPLGTGIVDQLLLYAFSIILPWILYLAITKWEGIKYLRSPDNRAKQIGLIALVLLVVSSIVGFWLSAIWVQQFIQSLQSQLNNAGNLGGL